MTEREPKPVVVHLEHPHGPWVHGGQFTKTACGRVVGGGRVTSHANKATCQACTKRKRCGRR